MSLTRREYKNRVENILPSHKRHERFFNAFAKKIGFVKYNYPKEEIISFLRSIIRINMYSCINPNNKSNKTNCSEDIKNINYLGRKIKINGKDIIDYFTKIDNDDKSGYYIKFYRVNKDTALQNDENYIEFLRFLNYYNIPIDNIYNYLILTIDLVGNIKTSKSKSRKSKSKTKTKTLSKSYKPLMRLSEEDEEIMSVDTFDPIKLNNVKQFCNESHICFAFGNETDFLINFFNFNKNFKYATEIHEMTNGENGIVELITYERESYKAYSILKRINIHKKSKHSSSQNLDRLNNLDNLIYEYFVGHFYINHIKKKYPIFIETYGFIEDLKIENNLLITIDPKTHKEHLELKWNPLILDSLQDLKIKNINYREINNILSFACNNPYKVGLLTEDLYNSKTLHSILEDNLIFWKEDLINVLFQIYYCLTMIGNDFTHYDLHAENVLIYQVLNDMYIQYNYHFTETNKIVRFQSKYLVKIIDYGRCYFNSSDVNSSEIYTMICNNQQCNFNTTCGKTKGFKWLSDPNELKVENDYLNSSRKNISHDLRLFDYIDKAFLHKRENIDLLFGQLDNIQERKLFYKLFKDVYYEKEFGTIEIEDHPPSNRILNINDALKRITELMSTISKNKYPKSKLIGTLNIYNDGRDMEYI